MHDFSRIQYCDCVIQIISGRFFAIFIELINTDFLCEPKPGNIDVGCTDNPAPVNCVSSTKFLDDYPGYIKWRGNEKCHEKTTAEALQNIPYASKSSQYRRHNILMGTECKLIAKAEYFI